METHILRHQSPEKLVPRTNDLLVDMNQREYMMHLISKCGFRKQELANILNIPLKTLILILEGQEPTEPMESILGERLGWPYTP